MNNALKKTKIVCTIGPSSEAEPILREMIQSGMNIARLNFSHGSYDDHALIMGRVRKIAADLAVPVAIMQDLQGPKVRVGLLEKPFSVVAGQEIILGKDVSIDFDIFDTVRVGERILIEDGRIELKVASKSDIKPGEVGARLITCTTVTGGSIQSHKGVNIPDSTILFPVITEKDIADLHFGLDNDIDAVAVSFVRNKADILEIKKIIAGHAAAPLVIAKIEKKEAIANIDEIIEVSDGIMVARGDLGVEMPEEEVAILQKKIVELCRRAGKPVIVATQMLESMLSNPKPTRAEVSDVSNAVIDGTDCVMLSEETASGQYPV
ncbi:MAG: pyruvate kinase, partial [bacterium]